MPVAAIPAAIGVVGGLASAAGAGAGVGKNRKSTFNFGQNEQYDKNRFEYGGQPGGAAAASQGYTQRADAAQNRQGVQVNYDQANQQLAQGQAARAHQAGQLPTKLLQLLDIENHEHVVFEKRIDYILATFMIFV